MQVSLQLEAMAVLAACVQSVLIRAQLRDCSALQCLFTLLGQPDNLYTNPDALRLRARTLLVLAPCLYDAVLRPQLLQMGVLARCV